MSSSTQLLLASFSHFSYLVTNYSRFIGQYLTHLCAEIKNPYTLRQFVSGFAFIWLLFLLYPTKAPTPSIVNVIITPRQAIAYSRLASHLNSLGHPILAIRELKLAGRLNPQAKPIYDHQIAQLELLAAAPTTIPREIINLTLWPNSRDKYLNLALKFHQIGLDSLARHYLSLAKNLDPNYPEIMKLNALIE